MFEYKKYVYPLKTIHKISSVNINIKIELRNHTVKSIGKMKKYFVNTKCQYINILFKCIIIQKILLNSPITPV